MSLRERGIKYIAEHGGQMPSRNDILHMMQAQMQEYTDRVFQTPIEKGDLPIAAAAHKIMYQSIYNMLEDEEKGVCDELLGNTGAISSMSTEPKKGGLKK